MAGTKGSPPLAPVLKTPSLLPSVFYLQKERAYASRVKKERQNTIRNRVLAAQERKAALIKDSEVSYS